MSSIFKVRHKPSGRYLTGSNYASLALRLEGKPPVGKIWNFKKDAEKHLNWLTVSPFCINHLNAEDFEIVEFELVEKK